MVYVFSKPNNLEKSISFDSGINFHSLNWTFECLPFTSRPQDALGPELILPASIEFRESCKYYLKSGITKLTVY